MPPPDRSPDFTRRVVSTRGQVVEFDTPEAADEALTRTDARGRPIFVRDTPGARAARIERRTYGDRPIAAGAAGAARGATFGLSDAAGAALGYGEDLDALERQNQEVSLLGEVVGGIAPVLLTGPLGAAGGVAEGASLVGRGARLAALPARAVAGLADGTGGAVGGLLRGAGTSAVRRGLGTVGRVAAEGAVEGAFSEGGRIITEAALGRDPDLTAEGILMRVGSGAMLGAGGGAILGAAGATIGEGARRLRQATSGASDMARRAWRDSVGTELSPRVANAWALASGADPEMLTRWTSLTADGRALRALERRGDDVYDAGTREVAGSLDALERGRAHAADFWSAGLKRDQVVRRINGERIADQATVANDALARVRAFTSRVRDTPGDYFGSNVVARARAIDQVIEARASAMVRGMERGGTEGAADIFQTLDELKRAIGRTRADRSVARSAAADELGEIYEGIRQSLERSDLWGDAAEIQANVNRAFTSELSSRQAFARRFLGGDGARDDVDAFRTLNTADTRTINNFLRQTGTVANETAEGTFETTIDSTRNLLRAMDENLDLPANVRADVARALSGSENALATFNRVRSEARELNQWRRLQAATDSSSRAIASALAGSVVGGPAGAALAAMASNPALAVRALGTIERIGAGASDQIGDSVRAFLRRGRASASDLATEGGRRARLATVGGVEAYRARVAQMDEDQRDPRRAIARMSSRVDGMEAAPGVRNALVNTMVRGSQYLAAHRPPSRDINGQIRPDLQAPPADEEIAAFLRRARVVDNPATVLADLQRGDLTPEAVEAMREVYPRLFEEVRNRVIRELATSGAEIDYDRRLALGILLGVPTDPALTPEHMALTQSIYAASTAAAVNPRPTARAPNVASGMMTGTDALVARRS